MRLFETPYHMGDAPHVGHRFLEVLDRSGLVGRGGAGFPTATKWRAVAQRSRGDAVILVNGAEGEPRSRKDSVLMATRPHLVLDGAIIAARVLRARRIVLYVGERDHAARDAMLRALGERREPERNLVTMFSAPQRYVAGAEAAAVHLVNEGIATPTTVPPYPFERGVDGAPTLVQNVETLAHVAVLARTGVLPGTVLVTLAGGVARPGVVEVAARTTIGDAIAQIGGVTGVPRAVLVGGYFGSWVGRERAWSLELDHASLRAQGLGLGCAVVGFLPERRCPVCETAGIMRFLAGESSAQCGPCFFGLRALADASMRIAEGGANAQDVGRLQRWAVDVRGRGACKHPDGAAIFLSSALALFAREFAEHRPHTATRTA